MIHIILYELYGVPGVKRSKTTGVKSTHNQEFIRFMVYNQKFKYDSSIILVVF
jgi:hypothetical protein